MQQKRVLTGIKPTAQQLHIGNYFGAITPILQFQEEYDDVFLFIANQHASTTMHDAEAMKKNIISIVRTYVACGVDPERVVIYKQSDMPGAVQLAWLLSCVTPMGAMQRMHAYKASVDQGAHDGVSVGTFNYPILQAADILLYDAHMVPVGQDQKQHIEFARDIAQKYNHLYGELFVLPEPLIREETGTVAGLDGRKMSKSYNNFIGLFEDPADIAKKIKKIATDAIPIDQPKDPDTCTLFHITSLFLSEDEKQKLAADYRAGGLSYKDVKEMLTTKMLAVIEPIQERARQFDDDAIQAILDAGRDRVAPMAAAKIEQVYKAVGYDI